MSCQELRCKRQRPALTIKEVADKTFLQHRAAGVSCQLRSCSRAESKSRRLKIPQAIRVFGQQMRVYGELTEHEEVVFPFERGRRKRTGKTFHHLGISARGLRKTCDASFGMTKADPTAVHLPSRTRMRQGGGKPSRPPRAGSS